jgi:spore maturation protein CgeB
MTIELNARILIVGDSSSPIHEPSVFNALTHLGYSAAVFGWSSYLSWTFDSSGNPFRWNFQRLCDHVFIFGHNLSRINLDLLHFCSIYRPHLILFYRQTHIFASTIRSLKKLYPSTKLVSYNNDNPFSPSYFYPYWRHHRRAIPFFDLVAAYRVSNLYEYKTFGAKRLLLLPPWFEPSNVPNQLIPASSRPLDVIFVGHYEDDTRLEYLEYLALNKISVTISGPPHQWNPVLSSSPYFNTLPSDSMRSGAEYYNLISRAKIALCFFSKKNVDVYTRRCFEIPACGTILLSEYSPILSNFFSLESEYFCFSSKSQLYKIVQRLLSNPLLLDSVSANAYSRAHNSGYDVNSRIAQLLSSL